jgi:hypothetical protein
MTRCPYVNWRSTLTANLMRISENVTGQTVSAVRDDTSSNESEIRQGSPWSPGEAL